MGGQKWMDNHPSSYPGSEDVCQSLRGVPGQRSPSLLPWPGLLSHSRGLVLPGDITQLKINCLSSKLHPRVCFWESPAEVTGHMRASRDGDRPLSLEAFGWQIPQPLLEVQSPWVFSDATPPLSTYSIPPFPPPSRL